MRVRVVGVRPGVGVQQFTQLPCPSPGVELSSPTHAGQSCAAGTGLGLK